MKKRTAFIYLLFFILFQGHQVLAQTSLGFISTQGNNGVLNLRIISVADAQAAGNGVIKIKLSDGTVGAADLVLTSNTYASPIRVQTPYGVRSWRKEGQFSFAYGGANSEFFTDMVIANDGGYALGGYTDSWGVGSDDLLLIKTNAAGIIEWASVYGGTDSDNCQSLIQSNDGEYLMLGTISNGPVHYMYFNFISLTGSSTLAGYFQLETGYASGNDVIQCTDSNFVGIGSVDGVGSGGTDVYITKFDSDAETIWAESIGSSDDETGKGIVQRPDEGYVIVGSKNTDGDFDAYFLMIDSAGASAISYSIGGTASESAEAVCKSADDGYVFVGKTSSYGAGSWDIYLVKRSSTGSSVWSRAIGGSGSELGEDVTETSDGGFAITGSTGSFGMGSSDLWLIKTDSLGNPQWSWVFGGTGGDKGYSVKQAPDGCFYVAGITGSFGAGGNDAILVKFTPDGESCLGYAVGFNSDMASLEESDDTFKARRFDDFMVTDIPNCDRVIHPKSQRLKEKFKVIASPSRDFVTPTTTTVCD